MRYLLRSAQLALLAFAVACDSATEPEPTPTTVVVSPGQLNFPAIGQSQSLQAQVLDQNGEAMSGVSVTWSSSAQGVAEVSSAGAVTSRGNGTAQITATAGSASGSAAVQVSQTVASINLSSNLLNFASFGVSQTLTAQVRDANATPVAGASVAWSSSETAVATVSQAGVVTAVGNGTAQITVQSGTTTAVAQVEVAQVPASVELAPNAITFDAFGASDTLSAQVRDANANVMSGVALTWASSAGSVATVNQAGAVVAQSNGSAQITASAGAVAGTATVQVTQAVTQLSIVSGNAQEAAPGAALAEQLVVEARDRLNGLVSGASITFAVTAGGGTVEPTTATTDAVGRASTQWTLGPTVIPQAVVAATAGREVTFTASATAPPEVGGIISSISVGGIVGAARNGSPASDPAAPTLGVVGSETIIPGGGAQYAIVGAESFTTLYVFVQGREGYYEVDVSALGGTSPGRTAGSLLQAITDASLLVTTGTDLPAGEFVFEFAAGVGRGAGPRTAREVTVQTVGTGGVQVSVSWNTAADIDLYLVEPSGETIYYGNETSASGGVLDLDSNAACGAPDLRNENINWPSSTPPAGTYTVRVNHWSNCQATRTDWLVTVRAPGEPVRTFTGTYTGAGVAGGESAGQVVTTFTVGAAPAMARSDAVSAPVRKPLSDSARRKLSAKP